jgi:hypothetical protein
MECPFCLEDFNDEALVCKGCGRDLRLVRPLIDENLALVARVEELQTRVERARVAVKRATEPIAFWSSHSAIYVAAPVILLIAAHFLIVVILDISPLYLRFASMAIPLPFGFALLWCSRQGIRWSVLAGTCIGILSVGGMLIVVALIDNAPVLPVTFRDWRETLEYVASIALATVTGSVIAILIRRMLPRTLDSTGAPSPAAITIARIAGRHVGAQALRRRAQKIQDRDCGCCAGRGCRINLYGHPRPVRRLIARYLVTLRTNTPEDSRPSLSETFASIMCWPGGASAPVISTPFAVT